MKKWLKRVLYFLLFIFLFVNIVAAFHAYKFTHFYDSNKVHTKRPEDMSAWEKTKVILTGVDYVKRPITEVPSQPFEDITIKTSDGVSLAGWYVPVTNALGTVVMFHGHGSTRSAMVSEVNAFSNLGYNVCAIDFRAHGESEGDVCTIGYYETADVKAAYDYVAEKGEQHIVLWGISMGASTITKTIADHPEVQPAKVILEMPFGTLEEAVESRLRMMNLPEQPLAALLTFWGGLEQGFWAFNHRPEDFAEALKMPVLLQWGKNDSRVSEEETYAVYESIPTKEKRLVVFENSGHESLLKKEPAKWLTTVGAFVAR
jgi:alpha-beta hydrolase superfamily lysophospholipase